MSHRQNVSMTTCQFVEVSNDKMAVEGVIFHLKLRGR